MAIKAQELIPSEEHQKEMHKDVMKELQKPHILQWPIKTLTLNFLNSIPSNNNSKRTKLNKSTSSTEISRLICKLFDCYKRWHCVYAMLTV